MSLSNEEQKKDAQRKNKLNTTPIPFILEGINKNNTNNLSRLSKEKIIQEAFEFHTQGNISQASKYYQFCVDQGFNDHRIFSNYGIILKNLGKLQEAEFLLRKAIKIKPDYAIAHSNLGNILNDLGKLQEAELSQRKAIELNPGFAKAHSNLGVVLKDLGKFKEAELSQRKAIELNPNFAKAHSNLGEVLKGLGRLKEAELSHRKAIELNPDLAEAHYNLGTVLSDLGKREEAMRNWIKATEIKPKDEKLIIDLAHNLCYRGKYELALKYLSKNESKSVQSLSLGCLLSLNRENEFNEKYKELSEKNTCNANIGGIAEHANIIYRKKYESPFCNEAIKYVFKEKITEESFSTHHLNELISYNKISKKEHRDQGLLTNGIQTSGNLFFLDYPFIKEIKKALEIKIEKYKQKFKYSGQGFINNWPENYELRSWMISMKTGGFLKSHNHEYGWITGSFYLQIPKYNNNNNNSGNIAFSYQGPRYPSKDQDFKLTIKKIETRDICIFPSSLFHHTIPFESSEERVCFVFDLVQK